MRVMSDILVSRKPAIALMGSTGAPKSIKTTPRIKRVDPVELELTWQHDGVVFNGINKIVQSIMSAPHKLIAEDPKVLAYFESFVNNLGNSGSDITWNELLAQIFEHECIFGWAFIENVYNTKGNRIVDWDVIDPKKMDYAKDRMGNIVLDKFGKPVGFFEKLAYGTYHTANDKNYWDVNREGIPDSVEYPAGFKAIFLKPDQIAIIKLFCVGDGFYPTGIIEPIYKTTLRKMNIEDSLANAIYRHGFPIMWAQLGDINHEPTPQHIESMLDKLKNISTKQEIATPYFYDIKILESKKFDKLAASLDYYINQQVAGLGIPKPFATGGGEACYSEDTMTLTENGWKYHWEIKDNEKIATFNPKTQEIEFNNFTHKELFYYKGEMHHYKNKVVDILVTPKHKMYYRTLRKNEWVKGESRHINKNLIQFKNSVEFFGKDADKISIEESMYDKQSRIKQKNCTFDAEPFLKLLGYYISEGWCDSNIRHPIEISNIDPIILQEMYSIAESLGLNPRYKLSRGKIEGIRFSHKSLAIWFKKNCGADSKSKRLPEFVLGLKKELQELVLDTLIKGDGSTWGTTGISYYTSSKKLFSQVCEMMLKCGYAVNYNDYTKSQSVYRINGNKTHKEPKVRLSKHRKKVDYKGFVYCYEVQNHLFITSRNGKIAIQGNTNRATLGNQASLFQLTLTDIIRRTVAAIEKYMFKPVAELEGFREVPKLLWEAPGIDQQEKKAKRILEWVKSGILKPDLKIIEFIKQMEDLE